MTTCPCCGWQEPAKATTPKATRPKALRTPFTRLAPLHFDSLSDEGRREYYKKTSPADDAYFFAAALDRQGLFGLSRAVNLAGSQYECGERTRAQTLATLQLYREQWGYLRTQQEQAARRRAAAQEAA